jgi:hypothetical protein
VYLQWRGSGVLRVPPGGGAGAAARGTGRAGIFSFPTGKHGIHACLQKPAVFFSKSVKPGGIGPHRTDKSVLFTISYFEILENSQKSEKCKK